MLRAPVALTPPCSLQVLELPDPRIQALPCSLGRGLEIWGPEDEVMSGRLWSRRLFCSHLGAWLRGFLP